MFILYLYFLISLKTHIHCGLHHYALLMNTTKHVSVERLTKIFYQDIFPITSYVT